MAKKHWVKPHTRTVNCKKVKVRGHYRGTRVKPAAIRMPSRGFIGDTMRVRLFDMLERSAVKYTPRFIAPGKMDVVFNPQSEEDIERIFELEEAMQKSGIPFVVDTDEMTQQREWHVDWSATLRGSL